MDQRHAGTTERRMLMKMCAAGVTAAAGLSAPAAYAATAGTKAEAPPALVRAAGVPRARIPAAAAPADLLTVHQGLVLPFPGSGPLPDLTGVVGGLYPDPYGTGAVPGAEGGDPRPAAPVKKRPTPGERAVTFALAQLGKPYGYGKNGPDAFDCSGLTQRAWKAAGISIPRTSQAQASVGKPVTVGTIRPGDLVVYYPKHSHVGIYAGSGRVVVSPHTGSVVSLAPLPSMPISEVRRPQ